MVTLSPASVSNFNAKKFFGIDIPSLGPLVYTADQRATQTRGITLIGALTEQVLDSIIGESENLNMHFERMHDVKKLLKSLKPYKTLDELKRARANDDPIGMYTADYGLDYGGTDLEDFRNYLEEWLEHVTEDYLGASHVRFIRISVPPSVVHGDNIRNRGIANNEYLECLLIPEIEPHVFNAVTPHGMRLTRDIVASTGATLIVILDDFGCPLAVYHIGLDCLCTTNFTTISNAGRIDLKNVLDIITGITKDRTATKQPANKPPKATVGADIEFSVYDPEDIFHAATEFVPDSQDGQIGTDGNVETLEIRPDYSTNPIVVVDNVETLLKKLSRVLPKGHDLLGGGGAEIRRSTGVHIHFGNTSMDSDKGDYRVAIELFAYWLDELLAKPMMKMCKGTRRADEQYGQLSDFRNARTTHHFPHNGFEYRTLPTFCINRKITEAVFVIAKMCIDTFEAGKSVEFNELEFSENWYKTLVGYDENADYVKYFVEFCLSKPNLAIPILESWFGRKFEKDKECDVNVVMGLDDFGVRDFVMYNPQKLYSHVIPWISSNSEQAFVLSAPCQNLEDYLLETYGFVTVVKETVPARIRDGIDTLRNVKMFTIGIPKSFVGKLVAKNVGSRNRVKMFMQEVIKHI